MRAEDRTRIEHMVEAGQTALDFVAGRTRADLDQDRMLLFAVVRAIEIVGEAAGKVSDEARAASPDIPWKAIIGMRNRLIHGYFDIDTTIVWKTLSDELPPVLASLHALLQTQDGNEPSP
jgi:uncharacterized protein with HEPN domain